MMEIRCLVIIFVLIYSEYCSNSAEIKQHQLYNAKLRKLKVLLEDETNSNTPNEQLTPDRSDHQESVTMVLLPDDDDNDDMYTVTSNERMRRSADEMNISDPSWSTQWHLHRDQSPSMGVYEAWLNGYTGKGVVVGLVDEGIDITHADLIDNYNSSLSYDFIANIAQGAHTSIYDTHGTRSAGVIAASKNNECVVGIAYEATIASLRTNTYFSPVTGDRLARAYIYNYNDVHIYSQPFGNGLGHGSGFYLMDDVTRSAIFQGISKGRNGKGSLYVFGAGNDGEHGDDCNADEFVNSIYTISVTSLAPGARPATYAEQCTCVIAATYGGQRYDNGTKVYLSTTNVNNTCIENYGGSAASMSVASGILALTLQANPDLTWRDIQHLIVETSISSGVTDANFYTNGAGKNVSLSVGFGLMNADMMTRTASTWKLVPKVFVCSSGTLQVNECCTRSLEASYMVDDCHIRYVEHVQVHVLCKATWREHTELHLVSPQGTDSRILRQRKQDYFTKAIDWSFTSLHQWGEDPRGNWTVRMDDLLDCDNTMNLYSWSLTLHGTLTNPLDGEPSIRTLGGYCDNVTSCIDGTDCLLDNNICVDCTIAGHRVRAGVCVKDGYGYCDESIACNLDNYWCNTTDNTCETCPAGSREINGSCRQDSSIGGFCDAITWCVDVDVGCDPDTSRCVNCTPGFRIIQGFCRQDGTLDGYCDIDMPCVTVSVSVACAPSTNTCVNCLAMGNHHIIDGFCMEDGAIGGYCDIGMSCDVTGSGCDAGSGTCIDCTITGYHNIEGYCKQDGTIGGHCDSNVTCIGEAGCDPDTSLCVNCTTAGYRVVPDGFCRQDGMVQGYCDSDTPCITEAAGCLLHHNICAICYAGHTLIDGFCVQDVEPESENVEVTETDVGALAGIAVAGAVTGVLMNGVVFAVVVQKALIAKTGTGHTPQNIKDVFLSVFKMKNGIRN